MASRIQPKGGKKVFSNLADLENYTKQQILEAQDRTMDVLLDNLKEFITEYVYNQGGSDWYERTGELYDIWEKTKPYIKGGVIRQNITPSKSSALSHNYIDYGSGAERMYQHQSQHSSLTTYDYVEIINNGLKEANSMFGEIPKREFWDAFLEWANTHYAQIFKTEMER